MDMIQTLKEPETSRLQPKYCNYQLFNMSVGSLCRDGKKEAGSIALKKKKVFS